MPYKAFLNEDGYIENTYDNYIAPRDMDVIITHNKKYAEQLRKQNKPVNLLVDLSKLESPPLLTRKKAFDSMSTIPFDRIAVFGGGPAKHNLVTLFSLATKAINTHIQLRHFNTQSEAIEWLKEKN